VDVDAIRVDLDRLTGGSSTAGGGDLDFAGDGN
jgi:hypothetical protein